MKIHVPEVTDDHSMYVNPCGKGPHPDSVEPIEDHLGGGRVRCHVDPGALAYLVDRFDIQTMLDIGCGLGCTVRYANSVGLIAWGLDGDPYGKPDFLWDYADGPWPDAFDVELVWSMEFVEHVDEQYAENYIRTFQHCNVLAITHAPPGKKGHHHVNLQVQDYWVKLLRAYGFKFLEEETLAMRAASRIRTIEGDTGLVNPRKKKLFVKDFGLVFVRADGPR